MDRQIMQQFMDTFMFLQRFDCLPAIDAMFDKMLNEDWSQESFETNKYLITLFCRPNCKFRDRLNNYEPFFREEYKVFRGQ